MAALARLGAGWGRLGICVNLSGRQLRDPRLAGALRDALLTSGVPPEVLVLEIAEHPLGQDAAASRARIAQIRELGVRVSLDDFGTGFSSIGLCAARRWTRSSSTPCSSRASAGLARGGARRRDRVGGPRARDRDRGRGDRAPEQLTELRAMGCELGQGELLPRRAARTRSG